MQECTYMYTYSIYGVYTSDIYKRLTHCIYNVNIYMLYTTVHKSSLKKMSSGKVEEKRSLTGAETRIV